MSKNKQVIIKTLPEGKLTEENYEIIESDLHDIKLKSINFSWEESVEPILLELLVLKDHYSVQKSSFKHSLIKNLPGSDNSGVPASEIKDKILPCLICSIIKGDCFFSLNL